MLVTLVDYGVGNIHSIRKALEREGADVKTVSDMSLVADSECVVLPGVGAFDSTMKGMMPFRKEIRDSMVSGKPVLGICIGAHVLFESSEEGNGPGLGVFRGGVRVIRAKHVPHMGWNTVKSGGVFTEGVEDSHFYFAHSYECCPDDEDIILGTTDYDGIAIPAVMSQYNTVGIQFHPEKSGVSGLKVLENFIRFAEDRI